MNKEGRPEIFFHIGMGKTASTFLLYKIFNKFQGIKYIHRIKYRNSKAIIEKGGHDRYLVSSEFDRQMLREAKSFSSKFPWAKTIIILRRHDSWIASQYRRFVKNGLPLSFTEYIDVRQNKGRWDKEELYFHKKIKILEEHFESKPLVLFYDDLRADPQKFIERIAKFVGATFDLSDLDLAPKHTSYDLKQLRIMRVMGRFIPIWKMPTFKSAYVQRLHRLSIKPIRYGILYAAKLVPQFLVSKDQLVEQSELDLIKEMYADDWHKCQDYALKFNSIQD